MVVSEDKNKWEAAEWWDLVLITWLSLGVHFWRITYPNSIVFDEVTFGKFLNSYAKGEYYFDLHPPLGKLIFGWCAYFAGMNPNFIYDKIGTVFTDHTYVWLRSATALAGSLLPVFVFLILRGMKFSRWVAVVAALLVIFENSLLVISRTFVFDVFLLSFGFASLAAAIWYHRTGREPLWWLSWVMATAAFSIKWTGLSFIGILVLWELMSGWQQQKLWAAGRRILVGAETALVCYFLVFVIHFAWTPRSGIGNDFMSAEFQSDLIGTRFHNEPQWQRPNVVQKFFELNQKMWAYQHTMNQTHPYSSPWFTWPIMYRPIYFWGETSTEFKERIYLIGNPWLWWSALIALAVFFVGLALKRKRIFVESLTGPAGRELQLMVIYLANFLPFIVIGRVMFIYHYLVALVVSLMILAVTLEKVKNKLWVYAFGVGGLFFFLYFAPLTYALPLTDNAYKWRLWFPSWL